MLLNLETVNSLKTLIKSGRSERRHINKKGPMLIYTGSSSHLFFYSTIALYCFTPDYGVIT